MTTILALAEPVFWTAGLTLALLAAIYVPAWVWRWLTTSTHKGDNR